MKIGTAHRRARQAFTLLELLVVISIIILVAAMAGPVLKNFRPNVTASATRQLLDDLARARQLAISQHTIVYVIFAPSSFWTNSATAGWRNPQDYQYASNVFDKQMIGYTFVSLSSLGDQPGQPTSRYLTSWRTLPDGTYFAPFKFLGLVQANPFPYTIYTNNLSTGVLVPALSVGAFDTTTKVPFPVADTPKWNPNNPSKFYVKLPYIAFDNLGRLYNGTGVPPSSALIPLVKGSVGFSRDAYKTATENPPSLLENPPGNWTNAYNVVVVDGITGRARLEHL